MKNLFFVLGFLFVSGSAHALEVGDHASCVVLQQVGANNVESEHCIRDAVLPGQFTIIEFMSITCSDCLANLSNMHQLVTEVGDAATVRAVAVDRNETAVREFIQNNRETLNYEVALDVDRMATRAYDILWVPTLFILDSNHKVVYKHDDVLTAQDISEISTLVHAGR